MSISSSLLRCYLLEFFRYYFGFIERKESGPGLKRGLAIKNSYLIISVVQISLMAILALLILSTVVLHSYNILFLFAATYISHISALFFILVLALSIVEWIMVRRSKILSLYSYLFPYWL